MQVKIRVEIDGQQVGEHVREVHGTLAQMEEQATALGREVACKTLQATVNAVPRPRPPFRQAQSGTSRAVRHARSSG